MNYSTSTIGARKVIFDNVLEDVPGGLSLDKTRVPSTLEYMPAGTLVNINKATRVAEFIKTAICVADSASGDAVRIAKGHNFAEGDYITDGFVICAITTLTVGTDYDTVVPAITLVNFAEGDVLVESAAGKTATFGSTVTLTLATGKTMTITDPSGKSAGLKVDVKTAADDNLAVAFSGMTLTIQMASTTDTKNTPAVEVQAAVRALVATGWDFSQFVLSGDEVTTITGTITGYMAKATPWKYEPSGILKDDVNVEGSNAECSVVVKGAVRESALPYPVNDALKAALPNFTFNA